MSPIPAAVTIWYPAHLPVELPASSGESRPKPIREMLQATTLAHRYFCVIWINVPAVKAKGAMTRVMGRMSTLERMGDAPLHAWK